MNKKIVNWIIWIALLTGILAAVSAFSFSVGSAGIPFKKVFALVFEGRGSGEDEVHARDLL